MKLLRLTDKETFGSRYAIAVTHNGMVLSSTKDLTRANRFSERDVSLSQAFYSHENRDKKLPYTIDFID